MNNPQQKQAIECLDVPCIVIAGPGTGKTTLITDKILSLFKKNYKEDEILALTFTDKAANEMSVRVEQKSDKIFRAKTFHSFALEILEEFSEEVPNLPEDYILINEPNQNLFFLENIRNFKLSSVETLGKENKIAYELTSAISKLKDFGITLETLPKLNFENLNTKADLISTYTKYELYKRKNGLIDFADILLMFLNLIKTNKKIRERIKTRYRYILVDEFQDTNHVQLDILKILAQNNITIVGDNKQSIYTFRGANYKNLKEFKSHFKNHKEIFLNKNYRSSKEIINHINKLSDEIASQKEQLKPNLETEGEITLTRCSNEKSQLTYLIEKINNIEDLHQNTKTIGILTRRKYEANFISNYLESYGLNISKTEIPNFLDLENIKSLISYLEIILNPNEANTQIFNLISNSGLRSQTTRSISRKASLNEKSIYKVLNNNLSVEYPDEQKIIEEINTKLNDLITLKLSHPDLVDLIRQTIIQFNMYKKAELSDKTESIIALNEFINFANTFKKIYKSNDLKRFLDICEKAKSLSIKCDLPQIKKGNIEVMTVHQSKGKEYDYVFIPFCNDRKFPIQYKRNLFETPCDASKEEFLEEEKRLFFVALSRTKIACDISYIKKMSENKLDSKPSPFIKSLDLNLQEYEREINELNLNAKEQIKTDIIRKIQTYLLDNNFEKAKTEINLLKDLYGKKDLTNYFSNSHNSDLKKYQEKLKNKKSELEIIDFNTDEIFYSVSQLQLYETCPKKYLYQYIYKVPTESRHYFDFGTSIHAALELLTKDFKKELSDDEIYTKGISYLTENWISKGYENAQQEKEYIKKGLKVISDFIKKEKELQKDKRKTISQEMEFRLNIEGRKLKGFIDRIDKVGNDYEILDYKTSNSMDMLANIPENMQLLVYSIALKEKFGKYPKKAGLWYLIHDKILSAQPKTQNIEDLKKRIVELMKSIEKKDFTAKPSHFACKFCDFNKICPNSNFK